jgi:hypothetical protein
VIGGELTKAHDHQYLSSHAAVDDVPPLVVVEVPRYGDFDPENGALDVRDDRRVEVIQRNQGSESKNTRVVDAP